MTPESAPHQTRNEATREPLRLLDVIAGDATDPPVIDAAVAAGDAIIPVIGAAYTRRPVKVYSAGVALVLAAMHRR
ncbi:hypothetical protein OWR29_37325 [Actinoplanes sp. Pm04-4]|uniref:Uncharacterized protein n=1 Tax=Paractinoplanes pyxinae TaxID=2997416 RepID=A0ABT4BCH7_9ACTN|nr:hypothetical protein [Actinoplanes pyxinae]MCY1143697.1 hypothetical protein [Actinoplanes pyxinae]